MTKASDASVGVCVIGREDFETGYGQLSFASMELLSRSMSVWFRNSDGRPAANKPIYLPSGRRIERAADAQEFSHYFYADIPWNGASDQKSRHVPDHGLKIAHLAFDSDELPPEWVKVLNSEFDGVMFTSAYLEQVAVSSGVVIPVGTLPVGLATESLIATPYRSVSGPVTFGSVASFHRRKGHETTLRAFQTEFVNGEDVRLLIHSNLAMGDVFARVQHLAMSDPRVRISAAALARDELLALMDSTDVFVSSSVGEGYSIGPREALAFGKPLVITDLPAHRDLTGVEGIFTVPVDGREVAVYPEIDNRVFGHQGAVRVEDVQLQLRAAYEFAKSTQAAATAGDRKRLASAYSLSALEPDYRRLFDPHAPVDESPRSRTTHIPDALSDKAGRVAGVTGAGVKRRKHVIAAHDGGFFSLFNIFASYLAWSMQESSPRMVIPDWNVSRLLERSGPNLVSYCYSRPEDGNLFTKLFEPMYGLPEAAYDDVAFLTNDVDPMPTLWNEHREPLLTYVNAYDLYRAPWFGRFRKQYSSAVRHHVNLRPQYQAEIDQFRSSLGGRKLIAAHVKHPAHAVEQPDGRIAEYDRYAAEVRTILARHGLREASDDWALFVATDQERVINQFVGDFGTHVVRFSDVERVSEQELSAFDELGAEEKTLDGHQLQHLKASDPSSWSPRLAWEVWRDAEAMATADVLIHAVSNVATAASYLGPNSEMVYCDPDDD